VSEHREYRDELAAYALGALDLPEKLEVERHVAGCEECNEYLLWLDPAIDLLPASVEPVPLPASVKRELMSVVQDEIKSERLAQRDRKRSERGLWGTIWRPVTAGVLSVILIAGAVVGYAVRGDDPESVFFEATPDSKVSAEAEMSLERTGDKGTLHIMELPELPPNQDFQAWIVRDGDPEPSTTFDVRKAGDVQIAGSLEGAEGVYITREPEGGSEEPTTPVILSADLS